MTPLLAIMVVAMVAGAIAWPLWRPGPHAPPDPVGPAATLAALEERKLMLYAGIRELGFDYRMDKLEEADYEAEVERLKAEAIGVVREIDELRRQPPRGPDDLEAEIASFRQAHDGGRTGTDEAEAGAVFCTQCGAVARRGDKFCGACGSKLRTS